ncbi:MAG: hypothetical protein C1943_09115 [Halochromatium sp.]|nr:hypothetical protein [Halochromatium sp.]
MTEFTGAVVHTAELKHPLDLGVGAGDHVIVYGGGETATDVVHDLATGTAAEITWAIRGGQHFFRKAPLRRGQPPGVYDRHDMTLDEYSSGAIGVMTSAKNAAPGMRHLGNLETSGSLFSYQGHGVAEWLPVTLNSCIFFVAFAIGFFRSGNVANEVCSTRTICFG